MLENDFPPDIVSFLKRELEDHKGECYYDELIHKIAYYSLEVAMRIYMNYQIKEMEKYKWIESQKAHHDLGQTAFLDWDRKFAPDFGKFWRKTHSFVPVKKEN
tara:strand:+ start:97 stop:405 length:309 start_codon:yes stop_codon:yes gene_type:complete